MVGCVSAARSMRCKATPSINSTLRPRAKSLALHEEFVKRCHGCDQCVEHYGAKLLRGVGARLHRGRPGQRVLDGIARQRGDDQCPGWQGGQHFDDFPKFAVAPTSHALL